MSKLVQTPDEILTGIQKPALEAINRLGLSPDDWLVVCGGFEDRALAILESVVVNGLVSNVVLIVYQPFIPENRAEEVRKICRARNIDILELIYDRQQPAGFGEILIETLSACRGNIFMDISGMSRLLIVQAIVALRNSPRAFHNCFIAYAEAQEYPPTQEEAAETLARSGSDPQFSVFFLSSGVFDVTLVPELSSYAPAGVQTRLVAFPSLDAHQLTALRAELQPSRLSFIEGVPPAPHNEWRLKAIADINRLDQIQNAETYRTSTLYYDQTLDCLLKLYAEHGVHERLLVSPTGSKMQAVAVGIVRAFVEDIQIVYPTPRDFLKPERYTSGVGQMHLLALEDFSKDNGPHC